MKYLYLIIFLGSIFYSCKKNENTTKHFSVSGKISEYKEGTVVLNKYRDKQLIPLDSAQIKNNKFSFKPIDFDNPELYYLIFDEGNAVIEFFTDTGQIIIQAEYKLQSKLIVEGSGNHAEFVSFLKNNMVFENKQLEIYKQKEIAEKNNDTLLIKIAENDLKSVSDEQLNYIRQYVIQNKNSFVAAYLASKNLADYLSLDDLIFITDNFNDTIKSSVYYSELIEKIETRKRVQIGKQAPDFNLPDTSGKLISLSSLQGKYLIIDFTASWHPEFHKRNSELKLLYKKYLHKEIEIFQVSFERNLYNEQEKIETEKTNWILVSDINGLNSELIRLYGIRTFPTYYFLDKNGIIIGSDIQINELAELLEEIFKI